MADHSAPSSVTIAPPPAELEREPLVANQRSIGWLSDTVANVIEDKTPRWWWIAITISGLTSLWLPLGLIYLISTGVGVWGLNHPVAWGWAIVNFVWWIGIGHAGTLISAILFLLRQKWRTSINRAAGAATLPATLRKRSRIVAKSGISPMYQNNTDTVK